MSCSDTEVYIYRIYGVIVHITSQTKYRKLTCDNCVSHLVIECKLKKDYISKIIIGSFFI